MSPIVSVESDTQAHQGTVAGKRQRFQVPRPHSLLGVPLSKLLLLLVRSPTYAGGKMALHLQELSTQVSRNWQ